MTTVLPWVSSLRRAGRETAGGSAWIRLRQAALRTSYYPSHCAALEELADAPSVGPEELYARHREFENRAAPAPGRARLAAPWVAAGRSAALAPWFPVDAPLVLPRFEPEELRALEPDSLAAPVETLRALAALALEGGCRLPSLRYGVIAFTGVSRALPSEADRDLIWRAFHVPLFTQFRGFHGELLAAECELHDGLHIAPDGAVFEPTPQGLLVTSLANLRYPVLRLITGFHASIESRACPCGSPAPRLIGLSAGAPRNPALAAAC